MLILPRNVFFSLQQYRVYLINIEKLLKHVRGFQEYSEKLV